MNLKKYEVLVIYPPHTAGEAVNQAKNLFYEAVKKVNGRVLKATEFGMRALGYSLKKNRQGFVAAFELHLDPSQVENLRHLLQLTEGILKFTIVSKPEEKQPEAKPTFKPRTSKVVVPSER